MPTELTNISRAEQSPPLDGEYVGKWGGYKVVFQGSDGLYHGTTIDGVRGIEIPVIVTIKDGKATVEIV